MKRLDQETVERLRDEMRPLHNALRVQTSIKFEMAELAGWHPNRLAALFRGIGEVVDIANRKGDRTLP